MGGRIQPKCALILYWEKSDSSPPGRKLIKIMEQCNIVGQGKWLSRMMTVVAWAGMVTRSSCGRPLGSTCMLRAPISGSLELS